MVVVEEDDLVVVEEVDEGAVVLAQLLGPLLQLPGVGDLQGAPEGGAGPVHLDGGTDRVHLDGLPAAARGQGQGGDQGRGEGHPHSTTRCHLTSPRATEWIKPSGPMRSAKTSQV